MRLHHIVEKLKPAEAEAAARPGANWSDRMLTVFFFVVYLVQLAHHPMWRDELNVFGIVRDSASLGSLVHHVHYEGHPWLWYFLVWVVGRLIAAPVAMKVLEAGIVLAIYALIGLRSPFSRLEKTLLFLNYFVSFEYTVLSRMYSVLLLLTLLYARERSRVPERAVRLGLILGLMASTDTLGMILSAGLAVEYGVYLYLERRTPVSFAPQYVRGATLYVCLALIAVWSAKTAPDISWRTTGHIFTWAKDTRHLTNGIMAYTVLPYFPVAFGKGAYTFWNPYPEGKRLFFSICFAGVLFIYWRVFRRFPSLLLLVGVMLIAGSAFGHLIYMGTMRQYGVTFLAFLVALWILRARQPKVPAPAMILLWLGALGGGYVACAQWRHPFTNLEIATQWLEANGLKDAPITGTPDTSIASFGVLLNRPIYFLECACTDRYLLFSSRRDQYNDAQMTDRLLDASRYYRGQPILFVDVDPLTQDEQTAIVRHGLAYEKLAAFTGADAPKEDFYFYRIRPAHGLQPERRADAQ